MNNTHPAINFVFYLIYLIFFEGFMIDVMYWNYHYLQQLILWNYHYLQQLILFLKVS